MSAVTTFFERYSWIILLIVSVIIALFGIGDMIQGMDADPAIAESLLGREWESFQTADPTAANLIDLQVRAGGAQLLAVALLLIVILWVGYRPGQRWAWYSMWLLALWTVSVFVLMFFADRQPDFPAPPPMLSAPIFFVIIGLSLLLSYRKFFRAEG